MIQPTPKGLRVCGGRQTDKEATLFALGIHSDTGSLVYECTTPRDAAALHFCLQHGASQKAIMQYVAARGGRV